MSECDPNQTTQFEVSKAGVKISSKRMSELVATLALVMLGVQSAITYHLYRQLDVTTIALRAEFAELRLRQSEFAAAQTELACVIVSLDDPRRGENCKAVARMAR